VKVPTLSDAASLRDGRWYRLHPLTPVLQGGLVIFGVVGFLVAALWETVIFRALLLISGSDERDIAEADTFGALFEWVVTFGGVLVLVGLAGAAGIWLQWRAHMVRMDDDVIEVKKGLIFRTSRLARRDRVNTVGVRRPLIPRLLGLAKLDIQAAGSDASVVLAYLPHATAQNVRGEILEGRLISSDVIEPPAVDVERVVEVPFFRYLASLVLSVETVVFCAALVLTITMAVSSRDVAAWLVVVIALFIYVAYLADRFFRVGSFVVDRVGSDLRISLGLLSTSVETIPPARIHALQLSQPWPWRLVGWWRIDANLASSPGAQVSKAPAHTVIVPVATWTEAEKIIALCIPALGQETYRELVASAVVMTHVPWVLANPVIDQSVGSPARAKFRIPLSFSVNGGALLDNLLVLRTGRWIARVSLIPLARTQSSGISVGPWHDVLGLAAFSVHGVSGPVRTTISGLDRDQAQEWWSAVSDASIRAIASSKPRARRTRKVAT